MNKPNLLFLFFAMINVFSINAETLISIPVATLCHEGQVTQFYGGNSLQDAHDAAVSGDVITLNSGFFNICTITKAITLRGACMGTTPEMEEQGMRITRISHYNLNTNNGIHIQVPQTETGTLKIEDISCWNIWVDSVPNISFSRVNAGYLTVYNVTNNLDAVQCCFSSGVSLPKGDGIVYSFVNSAITFNKLPYHFHIDHCVIGNAYASNSEGYDGVFENSIFTYRYSSYYGLPDSCVVNNCVSVQNIFMKCKANNCQIASLAELFDDQENTSYQNGGYIKPLTEDAAAIYLGTDGTQVGIYGGTLPFTMVPYNPIFTECDIDGKTDEDGKLKVKIDFKSIE